MSPQDWAAIVTIISIGGAFTAWLAKKAIDFIRHLVKDYLAELKPNGGGSMRDAVNINTQRLERVEEEQFRQSSRIDDIYKLLCEIKGQ